jgi:signal transduction histidine kinase
MRKLVFVLVISLMFVTRGESQQKRLDSLLAINNYHPHEDSIKVANLRAVFRAYANMKNWEKFRLYADSAILVASKLSNKSSLGIVYYRIGSVYHVIDRLQAITNYNLAIETARMAGAKVTEANAFLNLGALYMDIRDYPKSLEAHEKALHLYEQLGRLGDMSSCYMNMSSIHLAIGNKAKGLEYAHKALKVFEDGGSARGIAVGYDAIVDLYLGSTDKELLEMGIQPANRIKEAGLAIDKGLKAALTTDDNSIISVFYRSLGRLNERQGNNGAALKYYLQAIDINKGNIEEDSHADNLIVAGNFYIDKLNDFSKGNAMLHEALESSRQTKRTGTIELALDALSRAHEKQGHFDSALIYYRQAIVIKNDIYNQEKEQEITRRQLKIDFDIKERDYKSAQQLADARLKQQAQEIQLRRQQLEISDKEKTLQRLTFLQKQAELESQKKLQTTQLKQEQQKAEYDRKTSDQQIKVQNLQLGSNRRLSVFLAIVAVIVVAAAMFIYNSRKKTVKLNQLVSEQKKELEELIEVKDKVFSVVSHDMRGPMNNIIAFSSIIEEGDIEQERLRLYMDQLKSTMIHTSSLMENLLNWSASQMKGFRPVIENVNITEIIHQTLKVMEQPLLRKHIRVNNQVTTDTYVRGDRNMIELIVRNLVSNAIKFSKPQGILDLYASNLEKEVVLSVKDNGVGIAESKVEKINSSSVNSLESTYGTQKEKGTGLGLMLCKHFAALMGGSITVKSNPGMGSQFNMSLPAIA